VAQVTARFSQRSADDVGSLECSVSGLHLPALLVVERPEHARPLSRPLRRRLKKPAPKKKGREK
jgi:hypothetical protein